MFEHLRCSCSNDVTQELKQGFAELLRAYNYAVDTDSNKWDFSISICGLRELGLSDSDFRWLVRKRYVEHADEVTVQGDDGRDFRPTGNLTFVRRTCFVLTEAGIEFARSLVETSASVVLSHEMAVAAGMDRNGTGRTTIHWDAEIRTLSLNGMIVKRFKWPAENQEKVLCAFEEEHWPDRIYDPLQPIPGQDCKRRLADTIKQLNLSHSNHLIHFRGDGTGEGVIWEFVEPDSNGNRAR